MGGVGAVMEAWYGGEGGCLGVVTESLGVDRWGAEWMKNRSSVVRGLLLLDGDGSSSELSVLMVNKEDDGDHAALGGHRVQLIGDHRGWHGACEGLLGPRGTAGDHGVAGGLVTGST